MMEIKGDDARRAFLVFSLQCWDSPLNRLNISKDEANAVRALISQGKLPEPGFEKKFREAYPSCEILAQQMGKKSIDLEVVQEYFFSQHNHNLDYDLNMGITFLDGIDCKVYPGVIKDINGKSATVSTHTGLVQCDRSFAMGLKEGALVAIHRGMIAMEITPEIAKRIGATFPKTERKKSRT